MGKSFDVGLPRSAQEIERFNEISADAFSSSVEQTSRYLDIVGSDRLRVVRADGNVLGGLVILQNGQFFGGVSVPMGGIAAVAIAPEHRGTGAASDLLLAALCELRDEGRPISSLYPATVKLYRRVGYELAGHDPEVVLPARSIELRDRALTIRRVRDADAAAIREVYRAWASGTAGNLDRNAFNWERVRKEGDQQAQGFVVCNGAQIEGYAYVLTKADAQGRHHLWVRDVVAITPAAVRRLLTFFADYRTTRGDIILRAGYGDPLLMPLREAQYTLRPRTRWMLRIVDVAAALEKRGYPAGVVGELHLQVDDDALEENGGSYVLRVADGRGRVEQGGDGRLRLDIRGLAALYSGHLSPADVVLAGLGEGPREDVAAAATVFAGPTPWMRDDF